MNATAFDVPLPYTGKRKLHHGYNTQRRMPVAGRKNLVTSDSSCRIVDFAIQEGKGYDAEFFHNLKTDLIPFVTWEKHIDTKKLEGLDAARFSDEFKFNGKVYRVFEGEKHQVTVRLEPLQRIDTT